MPGRRIRVLRRFGHRGTVLAGFGVICEAYGVGLLLGYKPTFAQAYNIPVEWFGVTFVVAGLFIGAGAVRRHDGVHFSAAVLLATAWGLLITTHWTASYGWTAAVSWFGLAAGLLVSSAWPNATRQVEPPALPPIEDLTDSRRPS